MPANRPNGPPKKTQKPPDLAEQVGAKAKLKMQAKHNKNAGVWFGLGMMGVIGWSVAVPTLLGVSLGIWLDKYYGDQRSWTLALLLAGLAIGCFTAWTWVSKENTAIHSRPDDEDDKQQDD
jgi:ATP synthase protein I